MGLLEELKVLGTDVDDALERFMGNASLYERMLKKLPDMIKSASVQPDFDCGDYTDIIEKTHKLKGVTGKSVDNSALPGIYGDSESAARQSAGESKNGSDQYHAGADGDNSLYRKIYGIKIIRNIKKVYRRKNVRVKQKF